MKMLLLLAALGLASLPTTTRAQAAPAPVATLAPAAPDTVAALHRLFAHKQKQLIVILLGTATAEVAGQVVVGSTVQSGGIIDSRAIDRFVVALLAVPVVVAEVLFYEKYNSKHEQRAVAAFEAHQLPRHLKRQLKARYFQGLPPTADSQRVARRGQ